uniref:Uncharacterized protein n=1 Tax=Nicotiana tabacum TaxID=4097 RepID=A0A1S4ANP5_TOBAC|nr:PREDICTED: uncharacterized protein LOC107799654 [Nicotiana tabacum]
MVIEHGLSTKFHPYPYSIEVEDDDVLEIQVLAINLESSRVVAASGDFKCDNPGRDFAAQNAEGVIKTTLFEVVDGDMGYNIIMGRPWLHEMKVVPSTYNQFLKFLTPEGIKKIRGDQLAARDMNVISVSSRKGKDHTT